MECSNLIKAFSVLLRMKKTHNPITALLNKQASMSLAKDVTGISPKSRKHSYKVSNGVKASWACPIASADTFLFACCALDQVQYPLLLTYEPLKTYFQTSPRSTKSQEL